MSLLSNSTAFGRMPDFASVLRHCVRSGGFLQEDFVKSFVVLKLRYKLGQDPALRNSFLCKSADLRQIQRHIGRMTSAFGILNDLHYHRPARCGLRYQRCR